MICPFLNGDCRADCALYNKYLKGCNITSFVLNFNKLVKDDKNVKVKTMAQYKEKYQGKSDEEIKKSLF